MKRKIFAILGVIVCLSLVVVASVVPCFADAPTPSPFYIVSYVEYADYWKQPIQYDAATSFTTADGDGVLGCQVYGNDFTFYDESYDPRSFDIPSFVITSYDEPYDIDEGISFDFSYFVFDSGSNSYIVDYETIYVDAVWSYEDGDYYLRVDSLIENYFDDNIDPALYEYGWFSISDLTVNIDSETEITMFVDNYGTDVGEVYHGSLVPIIIPDDGGDFGDIQEAYQDGYNDGYADGNSEGLAQGRQEGYRNGYEVGERYGYNQGYNDGYSDGSLGGFDNVGEFLADSIGAFLGTPIFGDITLGAVLLIPLTVPIVLMFLKLFAGG